MMNAIFEKYICGEQILKPKTNRKEYCWKGKLKNDNSYELRY